MKKIIITLCFSVFALIVLGQISPEQQKMIDDANARLKAMQANPQLQAKMQRAQHILDSIKNSPQFQKKMQVAGKRLDSAKKANPSVSNTEMPDINSMNISGSAKMPNIDSLEGVMNNTKGRLKAYTQASTPMLNLSNHAEKLSKLARESIMALANAELKRVKPNIDIITLGSLNMMLKNPKINIASTGIFILSTGGSPSAAVYLICHAILANPNDPWAINDLGVYFRDQNNYEEALQCYLYASGLVKDKSQVIDANVGWAAAYYGDFTTGEKYFDKALAISGNFSAALEGEAMIAYAKGDIAALFRCLAKEIKYMGGGGNGSDDGPSDAFSSSCGGAISESNMQSGGTPSSDPSDDHTFDSASDDGQDSPGGADVDDITYPNYKKVFINDPKELVTVASEFYKQNKAAYDDLSKRSNTLTQEMAGLKPLGQPPYRDGDGDMVVPNNFQKFVALLPPVQESLDNRIAWYDAQLKKKLEPFRKDIINRDKDMLNGYINALKGCPGVSGDPGHDKCVQDVMCTWLPRMYKSKNDDLDAAGKLWDDYYNSVAKAIQWYIDASAPFISRVHQEGWNQYLNDKREFNVRKAIIHAYGRWQTAVTAIMSPAIGIIQQPAPNCSAVQMAAAAPDPFSKKPKHIKEFEGPCYDMKFGFGVGVEETCHSSKFFVGGGPFKGFYEHVNDPIAAQNSNYSNKVGADISVSKDIEIVKVGDQSIVSASAGVEGKVEAQFNDNWQLTGGSSSVGASADIDGLSLGGIEASRTVEVVDGQMNVSPLQVTTKGPGH